MEKKRLRIADMLPLSVSVSIDPDNPEKVFDVRALTLADIIEFLDRYRESFLALYAQGTEVVPDYAPYLLASKNMTAAIIARAADRDEEADDIAKLPVDVQIVALTEIVRLSVTDPKKLTEALKSVATHLQRLRVAAAAAQSLNLPTASQA